MRFLFMQLHLNTKQKFEFPYHLIDGERLLSVVVGVVIFSADKPSDSHGATFQYCQVFLKYKKVVKIVSKVVHHH